MADSGADNNVFIEDEMDRGPPPSYPGTPTNFIRITPSGVTEEEDTPINKKNGVPDMFVGVPQTEPYYALPNYVDQQTIILPESKLTVVDTKTIHLTRTSTPGVTCGDISGLLLSIVALILFLPLGLPAVVLSGLAIGHRRGNNGRKAAKYTKISVALSCIGIGIFAIIATVCIVNQTTSTDGDCDHHSSSSSESGSHEKDDCHKDGDNGKDDIDGGDDNRDYECDDCDDDWGGIDVAVEAVPVY